MIDVLELAAGLAELVFDLFPWFGGSETRKAAERRRIQAVGSSLSLQNEAFRQKIVEPNRPLDPQMK